MKTNPARWLAIAFLILPVAVFTGCSSAYTRAPGATGSAMGGGTTSSPIGDVSIELTPEVKEKLKDSLKFDQQTMARTVELALSNRGILNKEKKDGVVHMHITVTHVRVRNTFNAVMWGAMSGNDSIKGDVVVTNESGARVDQFHIDTSYALGGFAGGQDSMRMNWLYEAFAKQVVSALTGEVKKA